MANTIYIKALGDVGVEAAYINGVNGKSWTAIEYGQRVTFTCDVISGYNFKGWYLNGTDDGDFLSSSKIYVKYVTEEDAKYYAVAELPATSYKITYNANGGTGAPSATYSVSNTSDTKSATLSSTKPTRTGYTFLGWSTSSSASSASYSAGATISISSNITLYAVWKIISYSISYNANGGSGAPSSHSYNYNSSVTIKEQPTTAKLYTITYNANGGSVSPSSKNVSCSFAGWNSNSNGTGTNYSVGNSYSPNANLTLYAQWSSPIAGTLATPTRDGYNFDGWYTAASGGSKITSSSTISSSQTIYAHWSLKTYTISYNANGGTGAPSNQTKTHNTALTLSSTIPTRSGYEFLGWAESADATEPLYLTGASYTKNEAKTLYAVWKKKGATIYYGKENVWVEAKAFYGNNTWKEIVLSYGKDGIWKQ